ncbi:MAG: cyclodeaminase/cyclohydrolase family protein [Methanobacteriota archaeon]|nr:MAG: cyclodeaminase/cyclohydrolase family protein [Euryarchaeota archaeon]
MLKDVKGLSDFCAELSSSEPSPGGGTASASAGAMAASLLAMVCQITRKNKKHEEHWQELEMMTDSLLTLRDELMRLAMEDARAYDVLVEAMRRRKMEDTHEAENAVKDALGGAIEVPQKTSRACARILEMSSRVAEIGVRSAYSDVAVAIHLAEAGVKGALVNVAVNLEDYEDLEYVEEMKRDVKNQSERASRAAKEALGRLSVPA